MRRKVTRKGAGNVTKNGKALLDQNTRKMW